MSNHAKTPIDKSRMDVIGRDYLKSKYQYVTSNTTPSIHKILPQFDISVLDK